MSTFRIGVISDTHTHRERLDFRDGVLQLNSGSAVHPHLWSTRLGTVGVLEIGGGELRARIVRPNSSSTATPCGDSTELSLPLRP